MVVNNETIVAIGVLICISAIFGAMSLISFKRWEREAGLTKKNKENV